MKSYSPDVTFVQDSFLCFRSCIPFPELHNIGLKSV